MTNINPSALATLRQLLDWYDGNESSDDDLERIIAQARELLQQVEPENQGHCEYVLYDFDSNRLVSSEVYAGYADAVAEAAGLDDVLILRLPLPFEKPTTADTVDEPCDCEVPGFFAVACPGFWHTS